MEIGKKLKDARMKSGFTQEMVAEKINVSRQTISNWENEKSYPDIISVIELSSLYSISLDDLLKGDEKMKDDTKEIVSYVFVGGMTTLVNYVVYFILLKIHSHWLIANSISWIFAVLFAYYTNKRYVFKSTNNIKKEFISFILLRFMTLLIENICLYLLIDLLNLQPMISKVCVSFITILSNYILCKFKIFKEEGVCHG